jgi:cbb3-type cytochrome oxidase subunit 3
MQDFVACVLWLRTHSVIPMTVVFLAIAAVTYWPARRRIVEDNGLIPFRDES